MVQKKTAYFGADLANVRPGDTVAVYGAGPVGLLAAHSAYLRGAARVFSVDMNADRLRIAERFGATPVSIQDGNPAEQILDATDGLGVDCGVEAVTEGAKDGRIGFDFGRLFQKGLSVGTGQCPVKRFNEHLRDLIIAGKATSSAIVSHELPLTEAPAAYAKFDKRIDGYTKVLLHPAA